MWYVMAAMAAAGAALSYEQARKQNNMINDAARINQQRINDQELQARKATMQSNMAASYGYSQQRSAVTNAISSDVVSYNGANYMPSGKSINASLAANDAQNTQAAANRVETLQNQIKAMEQDKQNIRTNAQNSKTSLGNALISGAAQGASMGAGISSAISQYQQQQTNEQRANMQEDLIGRVNKIDSSMGPISPEQYQLRNTYVDQLQALNAGVHPDLVVGPYASTVLQPFAQQRQMYEQKQAMMEAITANEQMRYGFQQRMYQTYVGNPLANMGPMFNDYRNDTFLKIATDFMR